MSNNYQWFPGHMAKALRAMREDIKLVDVLIELVDARAPLSTGNPSIQELAEGKIHIIVLNKCDMADPDVTREWLSFFREGGMLAAAVDSKKRSDVTKVENLLAGLAREEFKESDARFEAAVRAAGGDPGKRNVRIMVTGIPNVGKSTFINTFAGRASAKTGNKPGVTRGKQWIRLKSGNDLLDTPGVLYVKPLSEESGMRLAFLGSLNDNNLSMDELALDFVKWCMEAYPGCLAEKYGVEETEGLETMEAIGAKRGCLKKGGVIDYERTAGIIIDDFRNARMGRLSLERPEE